MRVQQIPRLAVEEDGYHATESRTVKLSRRQRRKYKGFNWQPLLKKLIDDGTLRAYGCNCSHCQRDWDCCGNTIVSYNKVVPVGKRHVRIEQHLATNI